MATFFRHGVSKTGNILRQTNVWSKDYATKAEKKRGIDRKPTPKFNAALQSIAAKGFLRPTKPYNPPQDVEGTLNQLLKDVLGDVNRNTKITDLSVRYNLFAKCSEKFNHSIPNSMLHQIETVSQVVDFYSTAVDTRTPMDKMRSMTLPDNLHVQFEYKRWDPETDTIFGGITAFPESSTLVTGLKYKKKYKGTNVKVKHPEL